MNQELEVLVDKVLAELQKKVQQEWLAQTSVSQVQVIQSTGGLPGVNPIPVTGNDSAVNQLGASSPAHTQLLTDEPEPERESNVPHPRWKEGMQELLDSTPARIGVWRTGTRPLTKTMLQLRCDHAAAVDAVYGEVSSELLEEFGLFTVETTHQNTEVYLKRPDLGRMITEEGVALLKQKCRQQPLVQIVVSDGLSANAVEANLRDVYPALLDSLRTYGLSWGTPFFVKGGRVACMDHIGEILEPEVLVLLIGERPGLVTANSMSAYMCYRPRKGMIESDRTVISNIHRGGTQPVEAGAHIGSVLVKMLEQKTSGVRLNL